MRKDDRFYKQMVARVVSGEFTRAEAAAEYGVKYNTLCQWLKRDGIAHQIPMAPVVNKWADKPVHPDTDKAVERVLSGELSALAAAKEYPDVKQWNVARRVRAIRVAQGLPVQQRILYRGQE